MNALVSAVIGTYHRPGLVQRAIRSALNQTYLNLEVVVVVDGPEPETVRILQALNEPRLRIVGLPENIGIAGARNVGVREAKGEWVAFLDDDDEWLSQKIETQLANLAEFDPHTNFIVCRAAEADTGIQKVFPREFPRVDEDWSEYIFCRGGLLLPSTYLVKKSLMLTFPFTKGITGYEDFDWLLRVRHSRALVSKWIDQALVIYHNQSNDATRLSTGSDWCDYYQWARGNCGTLLTPKAFSYCLMTQGLPRIRRSGGAVYRSAVLLCRAIFLGRIDFRFCLLFFGFSLLDIPTRSRLRILYDRLNWKAKATQTRGPR
ncbi:MAG: glycosyltransferase [Terracidiphilus sp.]|jgi:glycosyltransferase involved in cell wall biosynthesis